MWEILPNIFGGRRSPNDIRTRWNGDTVARVLPNRFAKNESLNLMSGYLAHTDNTQQTRE